ncbi:hypothetical protein GN956_G26812, partial [Arapaima gigas]
MEAEGMNCAAVMSPTLRKLSDRRLRAAVTSLPVVHQGDTAKMNIQMWINSRESNVRNNEGRDDA